MMSRFGRFIRFGSVGIICAGVYFVILSLCIERLGWPTFISSSAAFAAGIPISYFGNRVFTYHSENKALSEFGRFMTTQVGNLIFTSVVVAFTIDFIGLALYWGALVSFVVAPCVTFLIFELWVYRERALQNDNEE